MHLGEEGKTPAMVEFWMSYPLIVDSPSCGNTITQMWKRSSGKKSFRLPAWNSDRLATPPVQNAFPAEES
jgi:hypothetical protein